MLTKNEQNYLARLPKEVAERPVQVVPWDRKGLEVADRIINEIRSVEPNLEIIFMGSMPLQIAGQRDIDLSVLCPAQEFELPKKNLENLFGDPDKLGKTSIGWHFSRDGYEVGIYLTDPVVSDVQIQMKVFNLLKGNPDLLKRYENLKLEANGLPYREYQIKKYEFYHRILGME